MKMPYHSALHKPLEDLKPLERFEADGNVAFRHDVTKPVPSEYMDCDVLYSEPAWQHGVKVFNQRVGATNSYKEYMDGVRIMILLGKPTVIIAGKSALHHLPTPNQMLDSSLELVRNTPVFALVYNFTYTGKHKTTLEIIDGLASYFPTVGDFSCGYGRTGFIFNQHGGKFVMSDYEPKCIRAIKDYYESVH